MTTETKDTYNGWSNYATWRVNLEIIDGWFWQGIDADEQKELKEKSISELADYIQEWIDDTLFEDGHEPVNNLVNDYARAFLNEVNYYEIAKHLKDED